MCADDVEGSSGKGPAGVDGFCPGDGSTAAAITSWAHLVVTDTFFLVLTLLLLQLELKSYVFIIHLYFYPHDYQIIGLISVFKSF